MNNYLNYIDYGIRIGYVPNKSTGIPKLTLYIDINKALGRDSYPDYTKNLSKTDYLIDCKCYRYRLHEHNFQDYFGKCSENNTYCSFMSKKRQNKVHFTLLDSMKPFKIGLYSYKWVERVADLYISGIFVDDMYVISFTEDTDKLSSYYILTDNISVNDFIEPSIKYIHKI